MQESQQNSTTSAQQSGPDQAKSWSGKSKGFEDYLREEDFLDPVDNQQQDKKSVWETIFLDQGFRNSFGSSDWGSKNMTTKVVGEAVEPMPKGQNYQLGIKLGKALRDRFSIERSVRICHVCPEDVEFPSGLMEQFPQNSSNVLLDVYDEQLEYLQNHFMFYGEKGESCLTVLTDTTCPVLEPADIYIISADQPQKANWAFATTQTFASPHSLRVLLIPEKECNQVFVNKIAHQILSYTPESYDVGVAFHDLGSYKAMFWAPCQRRKKVPPQCSSLTEESFHEPTSLSLNQPGIFPDVGLLSNQATEVVGCVDEMSNPVKEALPPLLQQNNVQVPSGQSNVKRGRNKLKPNFSHEWNCDETTQQNDSSNRPIGYDSRTHKNKGTFCPNEENEPPPRIPHRSSKKIANVIRTSNPQVSSRLERVPPQRRIAAVWKMSYSSNEYRSHYLKAKYQVDQSDKD